ncbi:MAG: RluA family pseudouridine synthase [Firmicutes bacterium HGW-Firmicutes-15]|nr:MAG: RluA family pseudouridine synthase [Firmicutes bacterium HGW-Firmicutes-15]
MNDNVLLYVVKAADKYIYLRDVLISQMQVSHSLLIKLKLQHKIMVNGQVTYTNYRLQEGDLVTADISLDEQNHIIPEDIPLDIVYEDPDLLAINKPPGLAVHPSKGIFEGTLANAVTYYWIKQGKSLLFRPINRLDKDTSGLILIGKSQFAHQAIFRQQKLGTIRRTYLAVVKGIIDEDSGCINKPIAHIYPNSCARTIDLSGKPAVTNYTVLKRFRDFTLLSLTLDTGRTHQIRVHLSQSGYPICGDTLYGQPSSLISRQALHAFQLTFQQPRTGTTLQFEAALPLDIAKLLESL